LTFSLLLVNLDHFQSFNEDHGVEAGNQVIRETANLLRKNTRAANPLCRCGGSTFAVILTETTTPSAVLVGEKIRGIVERHPFALGDTVSAGPSPDRRFTVSIGLATFFEDGETPEQLMVHANQALDEARSRGGNSVVKFTRPSAPAQSPRGTP
jgi:diguanylate cyclase (GGDEF)-like protein